MSKILKYVIVGVVMIEIIKLIFAYMAIYH